MLNSTMGGLGVAGRSANPAAPDGRRMGSPQDCATELQITFRGIRRAPNGACPGMQRLWRMGGATATDRSRRAMWEPQATHIASKPISTRCMEGERMTPG